MCCIVVLCSLLLSVLLLAGVFFSIGTCFVRQSFNLCSLSLSLSLSLILCLRISTNALHVLVILFYVPFSGAIK
jgi:hypothetical protein